jgi:hypothetical protein
MEAVFQDLPPLPKELLDYPSLHHTYPEYYICWSKCMHGLATWGECGPVLSYGEYLARIRAAEENGDSSGPKRRLSLTDSLPALLERYRMMPQLLQELIVDRAIANIHCTSEDLDAAFQAFCAQHECGDEETLLRWMQANHLTRPQLKFQLVREVKVEKFKQETWGGKLESIFLAHKHQFDRAVYSLIRCRDGLVAQEIYYRLQAGEERFDDLARAYSEGPEAQTGGLVGPVPLGNLHPTLAQLLINGDPGYLHPPAQLDRWTVIMRLEEYIPAQLDNSMRDHLLQRLYEDWLQEELAKQSVEAEETTAA